MDRSEVSPVAHYCVYCGDLFWCTTWIQTDCNCARLEQTTINFVPREPTESDSDTEEAQQETYYELFCSQRCKDDMQSK